MSRAPLQADNTHFPGDQEGHPASSGAEPPSSGPGPCCQGAESGPEDQVPFHTIPPIAPHQLTSLVPGKIKVTSNILGEPTPPSEKSMRLQLPQF